MMVLHLELDYCFRFGVDGERLEIIMEPVRLTRNESLLVVSPRAGSAIIKLALAGRDVLRPVSNIDQTDLDASELGEFPMAPWVNRVCDGQFQWRGASIAIGPGEFGGERGLHGIGWRESWSVVGQSSSQLALELTQSANRGWPFPFTARRRFQLSDEACRIDLKVTNTADDPMPVCGGFHPFFPAAGGVVRARVDGAWICDERGIPLEWRAGHASDLLACGLSVGELELDHCFTGWDGRAELSWPSHTVLVETSPALTFLQVYTPGGRDFFCVEPQSAMPDALNRPPGEGGLTILQPGDALELSMSLSIRLPDSVTR